MALKNLSSILLVLIAFACADDGYYDINRFNDDPAIQSINGTWKVISYEDHVSRKVEFRTEVNAGRYETIITFDDTKMPNEITGRNTSNDVWGKYDFVPARELNLHGLSATKVMQPDWGDKFDKVFFDSTVSFKVSSTKLRIYYDGQNKSVTFARQ